MGKRKVKERKPFYNPSQPVNTSSDSPSDMANKDIKDANRRNEALINSIDNTCEKYLDSSINYFNNDN